MMMIIIIIVIIIIIIIIIITKIIIIMITIIDALGGSLRSVKESLRQLVGSGRCNSVLRNMQKAVVFGSLNIARTFKVLSD